MKQKHLSIIAGLAGLTILLTGLLLQAIDSSKFSVAIIPLTGVGASILATVMSNWLLNYQLENIPIISVIEALHESSRLMRTNHELQIIFTLEDDSIKARGEHSFTLVNSGNRKFIRNIQVFTDSGDWNLKGGGFNSILEPSGNILNNNELANCLKEKSGKVYFDKMYSFEPRSSNSFEFHTYAFYRLIDRLIWTVQDFSDDMKITIVNNTGIKNIFKIKVNHHKEKEIKNNIHLFEDEYDKRELIKFSFNSDILPYQGFEIMWNLEQPNKALEWTRERWLDLYRE